MGSTKANAQGVVNKNFRVSDTILRKSLKLPNHYDTKDFVVASKFMLCDTFAMPKNTSKKLVRIARKAKRAAIAKAMRRFGNDRSKVADFFAITPQGVGQILARE